MILGDFLDNKIEYPLIISNVKVKKLKNNFALIKKYAGFSMILELEKRQQLDD